MILKKLRMLSIEKHLTLSIWLTEILLVLVFFLILFFIFNYYLCREAEEQIQVSLDSATAQIDLWIEQVSERNRFLATDLNINDAIRSYEDVDYKTKLSTRDFFRKSLSNSYSSDMNVVQMAIYLVNSEKTFTSDYEDWDLSSYYMDRSWFTDLLNKKSSYYQGWEDKGIVGDRVFVFASAITSVATGNVIGIAYTEVSPVKIEKILSSLPQGGTLHWNDNNSITIEGLEKRAYTKVFSHADEIDLSIEYHMGLDSIYQALSVVIAWIIVGLILLTIILYIVCVAISRWFVKRIITLRNATAELAKGNLGLTVTDDYHDELSDLAESFNTMSSQIKQLVDENYLVKIKNQEAQLLALQVQINPHFVYNTLDSVSMMALLHDNYEIVNVVQVFSKMMRYSMQNPSQVTVSDEVENAKCYLYIQDVRFPQKVKTEINVEPRCESMQILRLTLQPLLENAYIHGFEKTSLNGYLSVVIREKRGYLSIHVADNGNGIEPEKLDELRHLLRGNNTEYSDQCFALRNLSQRLKLTYGDNAKLLIHSQHLCGTRILIRIPINTKNIEEV